MVYTLIVILPMDTVRIVVDLIFDEFDMENNNKIDFNEFIVPSKSIASSSASEKLSWILTMFAGDRSGTVELGRWCRYGG